MALVAYSDSEGSDDEKHHPQPKTDKPVTKPAAVANTNFAVNKANPRKIQVKLNHIPTGDDNDGERASKRPRLGGGGGAFSGFNAMLPAPKRDADVKAPPKPAARKVFSLKTGAEPGFSREADAELRQMFAEREEHGIGSTGIDVDVTIPSIPKKTDTATAGKPVKGNPFMFKPLSVARNKKTNRKPIIPKAQNTTKPPDLPTTSDPSPSQTPESAPPPKKVSLFSMNEEPELTGPAQADEEDEDEIIEVLEDPFPSTSALPSNAPASSTVPQSQSLDSIATDLNLSKADRRQLFGRTGQQQGNTAINVVNFNTDQEYAANEILRANGEQVQHNPVRAIAPGKHSLKQLVSAATGQKDALEESFATGRRNKKEAGSKYGW